MTPTPGLRRSPRWGLAWLAPGIAIPAALCMTFLVDATRGGPAARTSEPTGDACPKVDESGNAQPRRQDRSQSTRTFFASELTSPSDRERAPARTDNGSETSSPSSGQEPAPPPQVNPVAAATRGSSSASSRRGEQRQWIAGNPRRPAAFLGWMIDHGGVAGLHGHGTLRVQRGRYRAGVDYVTRHAPELNAFIGGGGDLKAVLLWPRSLWARVERAAARHVEGKHVTLVYQVRGDRLYIYLGDDDEPILVLP